MDKAIVDAMKKPKRQLNDIVHELRASQFGESVGSEEELNHVYYNCQSSTYASGFQSEIMKGLYKLAKEKHPQWIAEKMKENEISKIKQMQKRQVPSLEEGGTIRDETCS